MQHRTSARVSLTALLGTPVTDAQGHLRGRLKDVAVATGPDAGKVAGLVLKTRTGLCIVPSQDVMETPSGTLELRSSGTLVPLQDQGNYLYLQQDLVDRQIIDIHGRKVVRVNDVDLEWMGQGAAHLLRVAEVDVGLRGAFRRVFKGDVYKRQQSRQRSRLRLRVFVLGLQIGRDLWILLVAQPCVVVTENRAVEMRFGVLGVGDGWLILCHFPSSVVARTKSP